MGIEHEEGAAAWLIRDSGGAKHAGTRTASAFTEVMALSESFSSLLVAGDQKVSLASLSP